MLDESKCAIENLKYILFSSALDIKITSVELNQQSHKPPNSAMASSLKLQRWNEQKQQQSIARTETKSPPKTKALILQTISPVSHTYS